MIRMKKDGEAMVVIHCFDGELPEEIRVELPKGCGTQIASVYSYDVPEMFAEGNVLVYKPTEQRGVSLLPQAPRCSTPSHPKIGRAHV